MISNILCKIFTPNKYKKIDKRELPSQGYFYPEDLTIKLQKASVDDQINYQWGINNSNIFGIIDTVKNILKSRISFSPSSFKFNQLRACDVIYLFIEMVKYTTGEPIHFLDIETKTEIEFKSSNFVYFDFEQYIDHYNKETKEFVFDGWRYSLPSIGVETSLNHFSYELTIKGKSEKYQESNYNLIYFMGDKTEISYNEMINLIETMEDLDPVHQEQVNDMVKKFAKAGLYFLIEEGKQPMRINPHMLKTIWGVDGDW